MSRSLEPARSRSCAATPYHGVIVCMVLNPRTVSRHYELSYRTGCGDTIFTTGKSSRAQTMKSFGFGISQIIKAAGVAGILLFSISASHAQSGPFTSFSGAWSGTGSVSMSDGSTERIRCKANYKVNGNGQGLKQTLRCASDSYRFDLDSDVVAQGGTVTGNWSEQSRNINGNLQGRASEGRIDVFVEAAGFAANLTVTMHGNKQSVSINSKGEIRGVNITLVRS